MIEGGCTCAAVRYTIARDDVPRAYACHCHVCQRATGSAFAVQAIVAENTLRIAGPVVLREKRTADRVSLQRFCGECRALLFNTNSARPGIALVRAGTLDRSENVVVAAHIFTATRQRWFAISDGAPQWPEMAPMDAFVAAMRG